MKPGRASQTALRVAIRRAAHQAVERPRILDDPISARLIGPEFARDMERAQHKVARDFRSYIASRARFVEEHLAQVVARGVDQFVVLGAGLDTFAYRNPHPQLQVFEVDFPATQAWKQQLLSQAGVELPPNLRFVAVDFEHQNLSEELAHAGFDPSRPVFFSWLGVVPYLTLEGFRSTLALLGHSVAGSGLCLDYALPPERLTPARQKIFGGLMRRLEKAGEPLRLFFSEQQIAAELQAAGFGQIELTGTEELNQLYFANRQDGLKLSGAGLSRIATGWRS